MNVPEDFTDHGEGPSRGLLCDYEPSDGPSFQALDSSIIEAAWSRLPTRM